MRRPLELLLLALAGLGLGLVGVAQAGTITLSVVPAFQAVESTSDIVTVDVVVDSASDWVSAYAFHVAWTPGLSLASFSSLEPSVGVYWASLPGDGTEDGTGAWAVRYDVQDPPAGGGVFVDEILATLVFHLMPDAGPIESITPVIDPVYDSFTIYCPEGEICLDPTFALNPATVVIPEPHTALLLGLGVISIGLVVRRCGPRRRP